MASRQANLAVVSEGTDQMKTMTAARAVGNAAMAAVAEKLQSGNGSGALLNLDSRVIYASGYTTLDLFAPYLLGVIAFAFIFIFTGVTFLRERSFGTIERLLVSPLTRSEMIVGYMIGFSVFAIIQSAIILAFAIFVLKVKIAGDIYAVVVLQILLLTVVSVNLGILCSSFARNEFQAVQFIPLLILPQVFLDGMFWPIATLPNYLQASLHTPLTYANDALQNIMVRGAGLGDGMG